MSETVLDRFLRSTAEFEPPREVLPYGDPLFPGIWANPVGVVVTVLETHRDRRTLLANIPDAVALEDPDVDRAP